MKKHGSVSSNIELRVSIESLLCLINKTCCIWRENSSFSPTICHRVETNRIVAQLGPLQQKNSIASGVTQPQQHHCDDHIQESDKCASNTGVTCWTTSARPSLVLTRSSTHSPEPSHQLTLFALGAFFRGRAAAGCGVVS